MQITGQPASVYFRDFAACAHANHIANVAKSHLPELCGLKRFHHPQARLAGWNVCRSLQTYFPENQFSDEHQKMRDRLISDTCQFGRIDGSRTHLFEKFGRPHVDQTRFGVDWLSSWPPAEAEEGVSLRPNRKFGPTHERWVGVPGNRSADVKEFGIYHQQLVSFQLTPRFSR